MSKQGAIDDGAFYLALLRHPHDAWRARHQWIYTALRNHLAAQLGLTCNEVQDMFEWLAANPPE